MSEKIKILKSPLAKFCLVCYHSELTEPSTIAINYSLKSNRNSNDNIEKIKNIARGKILLQYDWSGGNILEIGCAEGRLTKYLLNKKVKAPELLIGVEPSADSSIAKNYFHEIYSNIRKIPQYKFNLIYSFHTLEHIKNPFKELRLINSLLSPEGTLIIEVPNRSGSIFARRDFNPEHLHSFSINSITTLLEKANFSIEYINCRAYESPVYDNGIMLVCKVKIEPELRILEMCKKLEIIKKPIIIAGLGNDFKKFIEPIIKNLNIVGFYDKNQDNIIKKYKLIPINDLKLFKGIILIASFSSGFNIENDLQNILRKNKNIRIIQLQELLSMRIQA